MKARPHELLTFLKVRKHSLSPEAMLGIFLWPNRWQLVLGTRRFLDLFVKKKREELNYPTPYLFALLSLLVSDATFLYLIPYSCGLLCIAPSRFLAQS